MASLRLHHYGHKAVVGDLYQDEDLNGTNDVKVVDEEHVSTVKLEQIVLPLPGFGVQYPSNDLGGFYARFLTDDGIEFEKQGDSDRTAKGAYRSLVAKAANMQQAINCSEGKSSPTTMNIRFDLPAGCYATMLLREMMLTTMARD